MSDDGKCNTAWDEHQGYRDSGRHGVNPLTGSAYEVWKCQCGTKTIDVFPHLKNQK
ncbi:hypothetical protein [Saccharothrix hoggarensis]|uniref:Uncharacterized protein n=1 Tax=Saccharothrix hoggarensis TaxID=913853 RepID=A0ABW3R693_9PSEU